ncbi:hypothetical protein LG3211_0346 [Lysobacter gummosus]|nr:hypothetical protein LG3211_0346 [Lysobacter gummosus]
MPAGGSHAGASRAGRAVPGPVSPGPLAPMKQRAAVRPRVLAGFRSGRACAAPLTACVHCDPCPGRM